MEKTANKRGFFHARKLSASIFSVFLCQRCVTYSTYNKYVSFCYSLFRELHLNLKALSLLNSMYASSIFLELQKTYEPIFDSSSNFLNIHKTYKTLSLSFRAPSRNLLMFISDVEINFSMHLNPFFENGFEREEIKGML